MKTTKTGTLVGIETTRGSGIAYLVFENEGKRVWVPCENAPTFRALANMFGNPMDGIGDVLQYTTDDLGLLVSLQFPEE